MAVGFGLQMAGKLMLIFQELAIWNCHLFVKDIALSVLEQLRLKRQRKKIDLIVYESAGYVPQNIDIEIAEELQEAINVLQLDKVGRYSVMKKICHICQRKLF